VRLHVGDRPERRQSADLVPQLVGQLVSRHVDAAAAEAGQVAVAHLGADPDALGRGAGADAAHRGRVAGVEAAGHVGAGDDREQGVVVAQAPDAEALAQVAVQVHHGIER
jgi:hypothetical protein